MVSFLELDPNLRGLCAYGRKHGPDCILKVGGYRDEIIRVANGVGFTLAVPSSSNNNCIRSFKAGTFKVEIRRNPAA